MKNPIFDIEDGEFIFSNNNLTGIDSEGNLMMRISDNLSIDATSGELHLVSSWNLNEDN